MTGKELVLKTFKMEKTERIPWVPFVGVHAAALLDKTPEEYLKNTDLIVEGQLKAVEKYSPDGLPITFDLQIEAEALGCNIKWEQENPPAVTNHILNEKDLKELSVPNLNQGRIKVVIDAASQLRKKLPDKALYGLITGPFTLAMHLAGPNLFVEMYDNPTKVKDIMAFCQKVAEFMATSYLEAGCDIIALVDPMTTQIGPEQFQEFVTPYSKDIFKFIEAKGGLSSFFVCGYALKNLEVMCDCLPDNVSVDENIPLDTIKKICLERNISFGGNLRLTTALLNGTPDSNAVHAYECLITGGEKGFVLAPGCDLPYGVPVENLQAVTEVVQDEYKREIAAELAEQGSQEELDMLNLSDYGLMDKVIVDIITLDSEACAPCQYMVESVKEVVPEFKDLVIWREHKIKSKESVAFMTSLMVKNIPTIVIDGKISFVSTIPPRNQLIEAIQERINEKFKIKIKKKQEKIVVIGDDKEKTAKILENISVASKELGIDINVETSQDRELAKSYGTGELPVVLISTSQLKSAGKVPEVIVIKEWLKDLE